MSTSALSTATAVSALALVKQNREVTSDHSSEQFESLIAGGVSWLAGHQNSDGGWGDTEKSYSNIATSMLVRAAFHLAGVANEYASMLQRAERYVESKGDVDGLRQRYGKDKTFAVPILTNCALAGLVDWREVSALPFEAACVPQRLYRFLRLPVVSYAIPALVAIGQARYFHRKPWNPITRLLRAAAVGPSLKVLQRMQPESGGFLEAVPLTSFVVMSLASTGRADHPVTRRGVEFLIASVRPDGSWPIDTNLATWNTTLAINALASGGEDVAQLACLGWLLACQHNELHPFTAAEPGGWGWSDLSGAVPDADDTPGALLALARWRESPSCSEDDRRRIREAAGNGIDWLLRLQNRDGGWPTFCRGWGKLPFDRSGSDLTAHALRALKAWGSGERRAESGEPDADLGVRVIAAVKRGFKYLKRTQTTDGSWTPLWFGNQDHPAEENPVYGTAKVLLAYRDYGMLDTDEARKGIEWLSGGQNEDGGWGGGRRRRQAGSLSLQSSVEETALAVEALLGADDAGIRPVIAKGLDWLVRAVETNRHQECSPIGFYFAKLWYYEKLYPLIFTAGALGQAVHWLARLRRETKPTTARLTSV